MLTNQYGRTMGAMSVEMEDKTITMQQAAAYLQYTNREIREEVYTKMFKRRLEDKDKVDDIFNQLVKLRHEIAQNSGFDNFRDYMFKRLGRFDYTSDDCIEFHNSIKEVCTPIQKDILLERKKALRLDELRPWDREVDEFNRRPLKPFADTDELINKSIASLSKTNHEFGGYLAEMNQKGFLDLDSRQNKAPGGFLYPLPESNVPFIFMNATGTSRDVIVMIHESGHAAHSYLMKDLPLNSFKDVPSEVAHLVGWLRLMVFNIGYIPIQIIPLKKELLNGKN